MSPNITLSSIPSKRNGTCVSEEKDQGVSNDIVLTALSIPSSTTSSPNLPSISTTMKKMKLQDFQNDELCPSSHTSLIQSRISLNGNSSQSPPSLQLDYNDFTNTDELGNTLLHRKILQGDVVSALKIIKQAPSSDLLSLENDNDQTPLHLAALGNHPEIVRKLICSGAIVDAVDVNGRTPLHVACIMGHVNVVKKLLVPVEYKETKECNYNIPFQRIPQDISLRDFYDNSCVMLSIKHRRLEVFKELVNSKIFQFCPQISKEEISKINTFALDNKIEIYNWYWYWYWSEIEDNRVLETDIFLDDITA